MTSAAYTSHDPEPIDVVIAWVDGSDPRLTEKRNRYLPQGSKATVSGAHPTRFASVNEIRYCVLSICKHAPFVRNIFIITDGQDPGLHEDIKTYFPERLSSVRIVDHTEIFSGFEHLLPTFNSISIGHMIWRIKGLSERFVYFNDDIFLIRAVDPAHWFAGNLPVLRGRWVPAPYPRMLWYKLQTAVQKHIFNNPAFQPRASFHMGQWQSASLLGFRIRYFTNGHTPHAVNRKLIEGYFESNKHRIESNISYRFRDPSQFTFIALSNHLQLLAGNRHIEKTSLVYLKPHGRSPQYIDRKIALCDKDKDITYMCVQGLEMCPEEDRKRLFAWLDNRVL